MGDTVKIRIGSDLDPRGFDAAERKFGTLDKAARDFVEALKAGVGIDLGGKIVTSLARIPEIFEMAIAAGVHFNSELESAQLGIAGIIKQFDATGTKSFDDALGESADAIELLKQKALESPATFAQLVQGFQAVSGAATGAGVNLKQQVELIVLMSQALKGLGIRSEQIVQESRALITGNITEDAAAARILGITKADIDSAKQSGQLFDFLSEKMSAFAEAGKRGGKTLATALSNMEDAITQGLAEVAKPVFEELREAVLRLNVGLSDPATVNALRSFGVEVSKLVKTGAGLVSWAVRNAEVLATLARAGVAVGVALAGMKIAQIIAQLGISFAAWTRGATAIEAESAALRLNTAAQVANTAAARQSATARAAAALPVGFGPLAGSAEWVRQQKTLRPGGTTYAEYGPNRIGGAVIGSPGSAAARGLGREASAGPAFTGAGLASAASLGAGLGLFLNQLIMMKAAAKEAEAIFSEQLGDAIVRDVASLRKAVAEAHSLQEKSAAEAQIREAITRTQEKLVTLKGRDWELAEQSLSLYGNMLTNFDKLAGSKEKELSVSKELAAEEKHRFEIMQAEEDLLEARRTGDTAQIAALREKLRLEEQVTQVMKERPDLSRAEATSAARQTILALDAADAREKMPALNEKLDEFEKQTPARKEFQSATKSAALRDEFASKLPLHLSQQYDMGMKVEELRGLAGQLHDPVSEAALLEIVVRIAQAEKETAAAAKEVSDEHERQRQELERNGQALEENMSALSKAAIERREALESLHTEQAILTAKVRGEDALARRLEEQRTIRQEIAALIAKGLTDAEATAEAHKTAQLREQLLLKEQMGKQQDADAALAVETAGPGKVKQRAAKVKQFLTQKRRELEGAGFTGEDLESRLGAAGKAKFRELQKGDRRFGATTPAERAPESSWDETFKSRGATGGIRGASLDRKEIKDWAVGPTSADAWRNRFRPIADQIPTRPPNAPEIAGPSGGDKAAERAAGADSVLPKAAQATQQAAAQTQAAAGALNANAGALQQLNTILTALTAALGNVAGQIPNLAARVSRLESEGS